MIGINWPKYRSHKIVAALKVSRVEGKIVHFESKGFGPIEIPDWTNKPPIQAGGYLVQYENGYTSWSPADAFEGGYTLVESGRN